MTFTKSTVTFTKITQDDRVFTMTDGIKLVPRAGLEISSSCPYNYKLILAECIDKGWIKPVAYVKEKEIFWEVLS